MLAFLNMGAVRLTNQTQAFMKNTKVLFLSTGVPEDVYENLKQRASQELMEERAAGWFRLYRVYCRKA